MSRFELDMDMLLKILNKSVPEITQAPKEPEKSADPVRPKKCQHDACKVKLMLADFACRCKSFYCSQHRASEVHKCSFDYRAVGKDILSKQNPAIIADKLERI